MVADLKSILGDEVMLPRDLLPDDDVGDTRVEEDDDFDKDFEDVDVDFHYSGLALAYYNGIHDTDFKFVSSKWLERNWRQNSVFIHFGFTAAPSTAVDCRSAAKHFCSRLQEGISGLSSDGNVVVTSCSMADDLETTGCERCNLRSICDDSDAQGVWNGDDDPAEVQAPPLSQYSNYLADGVTTLSDKAKYRAPFVLLALTYYNKKQRTDYKLVDALPYCLSYESRYAVVYHCNFIARKNVTAKSDAPNKLFFAELKQRKDNWTVTACRVLRGETIAGCYNCPEHMGKRVIHPRHGFRFGLYPERRSHRGGH